MLFWFLNLSLYSQILLIYLLAINLLTFFNFGWDKVQAQLKHRRISEKVLLIFSLLGGSIGALLAMNFFRHKTKKLSFQAKIAIILLIQILTIYYLFL